MGVDELKDVVARASYQVRMEQEWLNEKLGHRIVGNGGVTDLNIGGITDSSGRSSSRFGGVDFRFTSRPK